MAKRCEVCGNECDNPFDVVAAGTTHVFDTFECAAQKLAPRCARCGCVVLGLGVEPGVRFFCCGSCVGEFGEPGLRDPA
jgi:hypothetical protein